MKRMARGLVLVLLSGLVGRVVTHPGDHVNSEEEGVLNFHGSGTTNPSKCFWAILDQFEARTKHPIRGTYRAIGSTTGIEEFVNNYNPYEPANDFASGDLPLDNDIYQTFLDQGVEILHLPFMLGSVSIFHSVPVTKLNLTSCLLARVFGREITEWSHPEIVAMNPELKTLKEPLNITVARRVKGSSSTDSVTKYLNTACPDNWPVEKVGPLVPWPEDTEPCEGSGGMTECIEEMPGTIGYIDSGHGLAHGLAEVELQNADGKSLSSQDAAANGGIDAAEVGVIPASADLDFSGVSLLNRPGPFTWPIVQMTYVYVRKNLTYLAHPDEQSLLVAFLRALYEEEYIQQCIDNYGFTLPSEATRQMALAGIDTLQLHPDAHPWIFEIDTLPVNGTDYYTISSKRASIADVEREEFALQLEALSQSNLALQQSVGGIQYGMTDTQERQLKAALALSIISFLMCLVISCLLGKSLMTVKYPS